MNIWLQKLLLKKIKNTQTKIENCQNYKDKQILIEKQQQWINYIPKNQTGGSTDQAELLNQNFKKIDQDLNYLGKIVPELLENQKQIIKDVLPKINNLKGLIDKAKELSKDN